MVLAYTRTPIHQNTLLNELYQLQLASVLSEDCGESAINYSGQYEKKSGSAMLVREIMDGT